MDRQIILFRVSMALLLVTTASCATQRKPDLRTSEEMEWRYLFDEGDRTSRQDDRTPRKGDDRRETSRERASVSETAPAEREGTQFEESGGFFSLFRRGNVRDAEDILNPLRQPIYRLQKRDVVQVSLMGIRPEKTYQETIDENGNITVPFIGDLQAADKTTSELEQDIRNAYIDAEIYRDLTVSVITAENQSYFVRGEIAQAGRKPLQPGMTVLQAIVAAGGWNDYASPTRVRILRGDTVIRVNLKELEKYPERDFLIKNDDVIVIPKSFF
jgi:protein involved in polysaccharide export with SLBB domain